MRYSLNQLSSIFTFARNYGQRLGLLILILISIIFLPISKFNPELSSNFRVVFVDSISPVLNVISRPVYYAKSLSNEVKEIIYLRSELKRISSENKVLNQWQDVGRKLEIENNNLKKLLTVSDEPRSTFITARVIADSGGLFVRTLIINAGSLDGVEKGFAIVSSDGLVGRIVETGSHTSRVLQLSDMNSRIPVTISPSGQRAILAGDNSSEPILKFLSNKQKLSLGDYVLTSGNGGLLPPGIRVGIVSSLDNSNPKVQTFINSSTIEYVKVINYQIN